LRASRRASSTECSSPATQRDSSMKCISWSNSGEMALTSLGIRASISRPELVSCFRRNPIRELVGLLTLSTQARQPRPSVSASSLLRECELEGPLVLVCRTFLRVWAQCPSGSVCKIRTACVRSVVRVRMRSELLFRIRVAKFRVRQH